jgi:hypothetical protein
LATNGSKWQQNGNILAADGQRMGSTWPPAWPQRAADWQRNGNKWQQGTRRIGGATWRARTFRGMQGGVEAD